MKFHTHHLRTNRSRSALHRAGRVAIGGAAALAIAAAPSVGFAQARAPADPVPVDLVQQDAGDETVDPAPSIQPGDTGELVVWWQDRLNTWIQLSEASTAPVDVDGEFDERSQWVTLMFQEQTDGVPADGVIDPEDRVALHDAIEALRANGAPTIERGDRNELAAWWQERLNTWIALADDAPEPLVVDGWYGPNTEAATIEFQEAVDAVEADGVVDPADRVALRDRIDALEQSDGAPPVERGDRNELAAWWQDRLNTWIALSGSSIDPLVVDGWYGPNTSRATV